VIAYRKVKVRRWNAVRHSLVLDGLARVCHDSLKMFVNVLSVPFTFAVLRYVEKAKAEYVDIHTCVRRLLYGPESRSSGREDHMSAKDQVRSTGQCRVGCIYSSLGTGVQEREETVQSEWPRVEPVLRARFRGTASLRPSRLLGLSLTFIAQELGVDLPIPTFLSLICHNVTQHHI
jgi:hypothetical protein